MSVEHSPESIQSSSYAVYTSIRYILMLFHSLSSKWWLLKMFLCWTSLYFSCFFHPTYVYSTLKPLWFHYCKYSSSADKITSITHLINPFKSKYFSKQELRISPMTDFVQLNRKNWLKDCALIVFPKNLKILSKQYKVHSENMFVVSITFKLALILGRIVIGNWEKTLSFV